MIPELEPADAGDELARYPVARWFAPRDARAVVGLTDRTLLRYERLGLPSRGSGARKRYAMPHTAWWIRALTQRRNRGESPRWISMAEAAAEHALFAARLDLEAARRG